MISQVDKYWGCINISISRCGIQQRRAKSKLMEDLEKKVKIGSELIEFLLKCRSLDSDRYVVSWLHVYESERARKRRAMKAPIGASERMDKLGEEKDTSWERNN